MMRKLDQRGVAALEFCLVAVPLFTLMFAIFDLGRICDHYAVIADARECWCSGNDDQMLHTYRSRSNPLITMVGD